MSSRSEKFAKLGELTTKQVKVEDKLRFMNECKDKVMGEPVIDHEALEEYNKMISRLEVELEDIHKEVKK